jgi:O-antigen ligase
MLGLVCLPLLPSGYLDRLSTIKDVGADPTGSAQVRLDDANAAMRIVLRNPIIGAGLGMGVAALNKERGPLWYDIHNVYLQYAMELGIPGLALFLLLLHGAIQSAGFAWRRAAGVPDLWELFNLAEGIQVSLVAFSVAALFYPVAYHFYFYYIAGLARSADGGARVCH